jgi:signal transduction histidine kinase/CheY-like chemotaxis protein
VTVNDILSDQRERQNRLIQRSLNILLGALIIGFFMQISRAVQFGTTPIFVVQTAWMFLATMSLLLRKFLPVWLVGSVCFSFLIATGLIGVYRYGMMAPALTLLAVLPGIAGIVWGARAAVAVLTLVMLGLATLVAMNLRGVIEPVVSAAEYAADSTNWIILLIGMALSASWVAMVGAFYHYLWDTTFQALTTESARRIKSDAVRDQAEAWWRTMAHNISGVLFEYVRYPDGTHKVLRMSDGSRAFWGVEPEEIEQDIDALFDRLSHSARAEIEAKIPDSIQNKTTINMRLATTTKSGLTKWVQLSARPQDYEDGATLWHCLMLDVSREVYAEEDTKVKAELLQQSERQKSIGQLTGGVAHDFNNLLAVILGSLELLHSEVTDDEKLAHVDNAISATLQGAELTRNMLAYSRQAPLEPQVLDLNNLVRNSKNWFSRAIPANIEIETSFLANLWKVKADEGSTVGALLNLVVNARDALPEGGKITIETSNVRIEEDYIDERGESIEPGRYVLLAFSDTGVGIDAETQERIFEPFFTTKEPGAGTGLGLAMVIGFMKQSEGTVRVYSEPGTGTTFKLYFPAFSGTQEQTRVIHQKDVERPGTKGARILLVEDEPMLLENLCTVLTKGGYLVQTASTGDEAARIFEADQSFDLIVTDIVMPGKLQGTTLSHRVREIRGDIPFVFMSGYAREAAVHGNGLRPEDIRLMKPIRRSDLIKAIETALRNHPTD